MGDRTPRRRWWHRWEVWRSTGRLAWIRQSYTVTSTAARRRARRIGVRGCIARIGTWPPTYPHGVPDPDRLPDPGIVRRY